MEKESQTDMIQKKPLDNFYEKTIDMISKLDTCDSTKMLFKNLIKKMIISCEAFKNCYKNLTANSDLEAFFFENNQNDELYNNSHSRLKMMLAEIMLKTVENDAKDLKKGLVDNEKLFK